MEQFAFIKKNFGFGCMRLPMKDKEVDFEQTKEMVDYFIDHGFNYFDTAHPYLKGNSEKTVKKALTERYPRDSFVIADKLPLFLITENEQLEPIFQE